MEISSYIMAWLVYLASAIGLSIVFWRMTSGMKMRRTRRALRCLAAVILFTPINIVDGENWLAPAYLVGGYDWILNNTEKAMEAGLYMSAAYTLLIVLVMFESVLRRLFDMERTH